jgi:hypothetical protein
MGTTADRLRQIADNIRQLPTVYERAGVKIDDDYQARVSLERKGAELLWDAYQQGAFREGSRFEVFGRQWASTGGPEDAEQWWDPKLEGLKINAPDLSRTCCEERRAFKRAADNDFWISSPRPHALGPTPARDAWLQLYWNTAASLIAPEVSECDEGGVEMICKQMSVWLNREATDIESETGKAQPAGSDRTVEDTRHSVDFRSVYWCGTEYTFTGIQAAVVKILWEAWKNKTPEVGDSCLLETAQSNSERLDLVFRGHSAWGTMITAGTTKGSRRLSQPAK